MPDSVQAEEFAIWGNFDAIAMDTMDTVKTTRMVEFDCREFRHNVREFVTLNGLDETRHLHSPRRKNQTGNHSRSGAWYSLVD
jgi:hypothetical protein